MPQDPKNAYFYDTIQRAVRPAEAKLYIPPEPAPKYDGPSLEKIQGYLQAPLGYAGANSILTLNSLGKLHSLNVGSIYNARLDGCLLDGGEF